MSTTYCTEAYISNWIDTLASLGGGETPAISGVTRPAWSTLESQAMSLIEVEATEKGAQASYDDVGNLFLRFEGSSSETIQIGSHLDTVPKGGRYDGAAGIVCGLAAILEYLSSHTPTYSLELVIWRGEESATFGAACAGSRAACGVLPASALERSFADNTLKEHIELQGFSSQCITNGTPSVSPEALDRVIAHLELHIEQGTVLETANIDIGVVTAIRGNRRMEVRYTGEAGHSGATPMGLPYRKDANLGAAYALVRLHELTQSYLTDGHDLVTTCGILNSNHQFNSTEESMQSSSITRIAPFSYFSFDARSTNPETLDAFEKEAQHCVQDTAREFDLHCTIQSLSPIAPVRALSKKLQQEVHTACTSLNLKALDMPCGAGHDCAIIAAETSMDVCLLFIPCLHGISHNPKEFAETKDLLNGARVLCEVLRGLNTP